MTLDEELQALKRKAEESPGDVGAWAVYSTALERASLSIDSFLDDNIVRLGAITKSILLAQLNMGVCPDQLFEGGIVLPGIYVTTTAIYPSGHETTLYLLKNKGLYSLFKPNHAALPSAPDDDPYAVQNSECGSRHYLLFSQRTLSAIRTLHSVR